jgi:hypothetical protein
VPASIQDELPPVEVLQEVVNDATLPTGAFLEGQVRAFAYFDVVIGM